MKRFIVLICMIIIIQLTGYAQSRARGGARGSRIDAARAAYITERLALTPDEAEKFWPIYHEFSQKRNAIRQQLHDARKGGADDEALLTLGFDLKQQELDLEKNYITRMGKVLSIQKILDLRVAERDFNQLVLRQIQQRKAQQPNRRERHIDR